MKQETIESGNKHNCNSLIDFKIKLVCICLLIIGVQTGFCKKNRYSHIERSNQSRKFMHFMLKKKITLAVCSILQ